MTLYTSCSTSRDGSERYILKTGEAGKKNLEEQHKTLALDSYKQLEKAGLSSGQTVWDIGCGSGIMTEYMANAVGEKGHVYALDISQAQIKLSQKRIKKAGLKNTTFIHEEITNTHILPQGKADIVYGRFILMHLKDPEKALRNMYGLLKPGGRLVLQESIMSTTHACIKSEEIEEYVKTIVALGKYKGVDFDIGARLHELCKKVGFIDIDSYFLQPRLTAHQAEQLFVGRSAEWKDELINSGLATEQQLEKWVTAALKLFSEATSSFYFSLAKQTYVIAKK